MEEFWLEVEARDGTASQLAVFSSHVRGKIAQHLSCSHGCILDRVYNPCLNLWMSYKSARETRLVFWACVLTVVTKTLF